MFAACRKKIVKKGISPVSRPAEIFMAWGGLRLGIFRTFAGMKKRYVYPDGETVQADGAELRQLLAQQREYLKNYEELRSCLDDADYVARGNGFCEAKYSEDFVEQQVEKYRLRTEAIAQWIQASETGRRS